MGLTRLEGIALQAALFIFHKFNSLTNSENAKRFTSCRPVSVEANEPFTALIFFLQERFMVAAQGSKTCGEEGGFYHSWSVGNRRCPGHLTNRGLDRLKPQVSAVAGANLEFVKMPDRDAVDDKILDCNILNGMV